MGNKTLRELAQILYGKSPNEIRTEESPFPIWGTGGKIGSAQRPLFSGPIIILPRKGTLTNPSYCEADCWVIDTAYAAIAHQNVDTKWLFYNLSLANLESLNEATGVPSINRDMLYRLSFNFLDFEEQQKIAEILTTVDNLIEQTEAAIAKYQAIKQGMMHDLFTRGVDANGNLRPPREEAPELYKESELGWIPKEWDVIRFSFVIASIDAGKSFECPDIAASSGQWGVLKVSAVHPTGFRPTENKVVTNQSDVNDNFEVKNEDLLITRCNTPELVGLVCLVENPQTRLLLCDKTLRLNIKSNHDKRYIFYTLQTDPIRRQIETAGTGSSGSMKNITQQDIKNLIFATPKKPEQTATQMIIHGIDKRLVSEEASLSKLQVLKSGLMQDLLSGRVRVPTDPAPTQEPPHAS